MTLAVDPTLAPLLERLGPYARGTFDHAADVALRLHAEELTPEHLLVSVLEDEECGAARLVLHAFGDPETIGLEVLALCPGIMVVGSERSLPFSVRGVEVLERARLSAAERGNPLVDVPHLFAAALDLLPDEAAGAMPSDDWGSRILADSAASADTNRGQDPIPRQGPLFRYFSQEARRALGAACRQAVRLGRDEISPGHLLLGCLDVEAGLGEAVGASAVRVRGLLRGLDADPTRREPRAVPVDARLRILLAALPARAGTTEILGWILANGGDEVRALLSRQRITPALLEHAGGSFTDPDLPRT